MTFAVSVSGSDRQVRVKRTRTGLPSRTNRSSSSASGIASAAAGIFGRASSYRSAPVWGVRLWSVPMDRIRTPTAPAFAALDAQTRDLLHDELERIWAETGRTIIFVTHNVREAIRLGDRVVLLTFRPGRVKREFAIDLPRPRVLEDVHVAHAARAILDELREEINRSLEVEYSSGVKPHVVPGEEP